MKVPFLSRAGALISVLMVLSWGCATKKVASEAPSCSHQKVENLVYFDVASCHKPPEAAFDITHNETILAGMLSVQPAILECFVSPSHRKRNRQLNVKLTTSVSSEAVLHEVEGDNLSAEGVACIKSALASLQFQLLAPEEEKQTASISLSYPADSPKVIFGINKVSDAIGQVRLALGKACHCYAPMEKTGIAEVSMALTVCAEPPAQVSLSSDNPGFQEMVECLTAEISKLNFQAPRDELVLERIPLQFINTRAEAVPPEARAELLFVHADGLRTQHAFVPALRLREKRQAEAADLQLSAKRQERRTSVTMRDFNASCSELVKASEAWVLALEKQLSLDKRVADIAEGLHSGGASLWEAVAQKTSQTVAKSQEALEEAQKALASQKDTCKTRAAPQPPKAGAKSPQPTSSTTGQKDPSG